MTERLRPRARLMTTLGHELISSDAVALTELVKDAFDADAQHVLIRVTGETDMDGSLQSESGGFGTRVFAGGGIRADGPSHPLLQCSTQR